MKKLFSIGELASLQGISRQTLIFYDKIGLFCPAYTDSSNGYRYYDINQIDYLDTICIMKKIGFSLNEIKAHMQNYTMDDSITALKKQLCAIQSKIDELNMINFRVLHRIEQLESARGVVDNEISVTIDKAKEMYILLNKVKPPYSPEDVSIATKECFVKSFKEHLPIYFQSGAIVEYEKILNKKYTEASFVFLPIEKSEHNCDVVKLSEGECVCTYHVGNYLSIGASYERILKYCRENDLSIISDSYEFAINDYLSTKNENEYITKIMFYIKRKQ